MIELGRRLVNRTWKWEDAAMGFRLAMTFVASSPISKLLALAFLALLLARGITAVSTFTSVRAVAICSSSDC